MSQFTLRSLKHEYEIYVGAEVERYKESVPRSALLKIADEAKVNIEAQTQFELTELALCDEVNRIILARLKVPKYETWRRRRLKVLAEYRRPEKWGLRADEALVREIRPAADGHVLIAGPEVERAALYLAAHGCNVTALDTDEDKLERVAFDASPAGLASLVRPQASTLEQWAPDVPLIAVVCAAVTLAAMDAGERDRVIDGLQRATRDGGVHVFEQISQGQSISIDDLRTRYRGWSILVECESGAARCFIARKIAA